MYRFLTSKPFWLAMLALAVALLILRKVRGRMRVRRGEGYYRAYAALLRDAFKNDKSTRDAILAAIADLQEGRASRAEKALGRLMVECREAEDFAALRVLLAKCYQNMDEAAKAEQYYRRVLEDAARKRPLYAAIEQMNAHDEKGMQLVRQATEGIVFENEDDSQEAGE